MLFPTPLGDTENWLSVVNRDFIAPEGGRIAPFEYGVRNCNVLAARITSTTAKPGWFLGGNVYRGSYQQPAMDAKPTSIFQVSSAKILPLNRFVLILLSFAGEEYFPLVFSFAHWHKSIKLEVMKYIGKRDFLSKGNANYVALGDNGFMLTEDGDFLKYE